MNDKTLKNIKDKLHIAVKEKNLKYTKQREMVFESVLRSKKHLSAEETYADIKARYPDSSIGIATVYKSLVFLEEANLITSILLNNKKGKKFEINSKHHHDHLMCLECDKIIEFLDDKIEQLQIEVANKHNFKLAHHTMHLYGICDDCVKAKG